MDVGSLKSIGDASVTARRRCCSKAARTPSPSALRQRMLQNCMSAIKSKRNDLIQRYRSEGFSDRQVFARQLLNEAYQASMDQTVNQIQPRQQRSGDESIDHPNELRADNPFANESELLENLGEAEHEELMRQIAEAVEAELFENYRPLNDTCRGSSVGYIDEDLLMMEPDELDGVSELDYGINGVNESSFDAEIICPVCTTSVMVIAQGSGGDLVCECGVSISLHPPGSSINEQDRDERNSLAVGQLKQRLADTYDRHLASCMQYANSMQQHGVQRDETMCVQHGSSQPVPMDTQQVGVDVQIGDASFDRSAVLGYAPTFQLHEGRLVSFCVHCGFHEAIT